MNSIKCSQCGFTGWANAGRCKKCDAPLEKSSQAGGFQPSLNLPVEKPSAFQILKNDALSFVAIILPVVVWGIYIAVTFFGVSLQSRRTDTAIENSGNSPFFLIAPVAITIICAGALFWRLNSISKVFESGERVVGTITDVSFFKDRGRIEFSYSYQRQNLNGALSIMKNSKTQSYRSGDNVVLIVDSAKPSRVYIQDLYV